MIDLHVHLLPDLDDGPSSIADSLETARLLAGAGVHTVAATPHVRVDYPSEPTAIDRGVAALRTAIAEAAIPLDVLGGAELSFEQLRRPTAELRRFGLAGNPSLLLVETPYLGWPLALERTIFDLRLAGFTVVLAHPERNPDVQGDPVLVERLVRSGTLVQVTTSSLAGVLGNRARETALELLERDLVHLVGSDTHGPDGRALGAEPVRRAVGDRALVRWLTEDSPAAIVAGRRVPLRPDPIRRRRFRRPRGGRGWPR
ncbi:MAG: hypothetical protein MSC30_15060 [Gaiellaceae bacterium MAG52_C11]|nr:hypothetical protein [Candidatus Gaiellasilicea maunaloa]